MAATTSSPLPFDSFTATAAVANAGVLGQLAASIAPHSNTKEIIFLNRDAANDLFVKVVDLADVGVIALTAANSLTVPFGAAITLSVGVAGDRNNFYNGALANDRLVILVQASVANVIFNCTYVQGSGRPS